MISTRLRLVAPVALAACLALARCASQPPIRPVAVDPANPQAEEAPPVTALTAFAPDQVRPAADDAAAGTTSDGAGTSEDVEPIERSSHGGHL